MASATGPPKTNASRWEAGPPPGERSRACAGGRARVGRTRTSWERQGLSSCWNDARLVSSSGFIHCGLCSKQVLVFLASIPHLQCSEKQGWASGVRFPGGWIERLASLPSGTTGTSGAESLAAAGPHPAV